MATRSCPRSTSSRPTPTTSSWPTPCAAIRTPPRWPSGPAGRAWPRSRTATSSTSTTTSPHGGGRGSLTCCAPSRPRSPRAAAGEIRRARPDRAAGGPGTGQPGPAAAGHVTRPQHHRPRRPRHPGGRHSSADRAGGRRIGRARRALPPGRRPGPADQAALAPGRGCPGYRHGHRLADPAAPGGARRPGGGHAGRRRRGVPGRVPQPAGRPLPARRGGRRRAGRHHRDRRGRQPGAPSPGGVPRRGRRGGPDLPARLGSGPRRAAAQRTAVQTYLQQQHSQTLQAVYSWILGGLSLATWSDVTLILPYVIVAAGILLAHRRLLDVLRIGETEAGSLGVDVARLRLTVVMAATLGTAAAVSVSGLIGFVGIIVPHTVRLTAGASYRIVLPVSMIGGAAFLVLADVLARTVQSPDEVPIGVITAIAGAPFFLFVLRSRRSQQDLS